MIQNSAAWTRVWHKYAVGLRGKAAVELTIDFTQEMAVAVFAGEVSLEARVMIIKIVQEQQRLRVVYRIGTALPGPTPLDIATASPFHIVRLTRSSYPVAFVPAVKKDIR